MGYIREASFIMMFRSALGDAEAGIIRSNVLLLFARYFLALYFIFLAILYRSFVPLAVLLVGFISYIYWVIKKKYRYVRDKQAFTPGHFFFNFNADAAVLSGVAIGFLAIAKRFNYLSYVNSNKFFFIAVLVYIGILLSTLKLGVPNQNHPFPYNMDEWHQFNAVRATFKYGTPNVFGAANGTMFHFLVSGFYLVPFTLLHIINPAVMKVSDLAMRERTFILLRLDTLIYGVLSLFLVYKIAQYLKVSEKLALVLFSSTPIWISLSGYFKYDIALMFWILMSLLFYLRFAKDPSNRNYLLAAIPTALAFSVKVSAIPLFIIYLFSFFLFTTSRRKNIYSLIAGIGLLIGVVLLFGMPDTLFGKGNIVLYLKENIINAPQSTAIYLLGMNPYLYLFLIHYPMIFGHSLMLLFAVAFLFIVYLLIKESVLKRSDDFKILLFVCFALLIFLLSLLPLQIAAINNRVLVLLPFVAFVVAIAFEKALVKSKIKALLIGIMCLVVFMQLFESLAILYMKQSSIPQEVSSTWLEKNIPKGKLIGIENIPIYQALPDIIEKEFYFHQYRIKQNNLYSYEVIDDKSKVLPTVIVIINDELETNFFKQSVTKSLVKRLKKEGYKKIAIFSPDLTLYKIINNEKDFFFYAGLSTDPLTISVYEK